MNLVWKWCCKDDCFMTLVVQEVPEDTTVFLFQADEVGGSNHSSEHRQKFLSCHLSAGTIRFHANIPSSTAVPPHMCGRFG